VKINNSSKRKGVLASILILLSGGILARLIPLLVSPILTRIYDPDEFGIFSYFLSIAAVLSVVATFRFEMAVVLPKRKIEALMLLQISFITLMVFVVLVFLFFLWFESDFIRIINQENLAGYMYYIPFMIAFSGAIQAFNCWFNRQRQYKVIASAKVIQSFFSSGANVLLGFAGFGVYGLIFGAIFGQILSALFLLRGFCSEEKNKFFELKVKKYLEIIGNYKDFPTYNSANALFNSFSSQLPVFMIGYFFGFVYVGFYALANRVLLAPVAIVSSSISGVFYERISSLKNNNKTEELAMFFDGFLYKSLSICFPIFFLLYVYIEDVFLIVFGANWDEAGLYAKILLPMLYFRFVGSFLSSVTIVYRAQRKALTIEIINTLLRMLALLVGGIMQDIIVGFILFSLVSSMVTIYRIFWYRKMIYA
jgi:O-antigen/teichoic acid export membrane protein